MQPPEAVGLLLQFTFLTIDATSDLKVDQIIIKQGLEGNSLEAQGEVSSPSSTPDSPSQHH